METYDGFDRRGKTWRNYLHRKLYPYGNTLELALLITVVAIVIAWMILLPR
jgi:hypothetical protein